MGNEVNGDVRKPYPVAIESTGRIGKDSGDCSSTDSRTDTGSGGIGGIGGRANEGGSSEETTVVEVLDLTPVEKTKMSREERNAKRRAKYRADKEKEGVASRPRKVTKKEKVEESVLSSSDIESLLKSIFGIFASRPNMEHWLLSDGECKAIAEPLAKILNEAEAFKELKGQSNTIALVIACVTVLLPRIMLTIQKSKEDNENGVNEKREIKNDNRALSRKSSVTGSNDSEYIFASVAPTA